jgi:hypothetical protein
MPPRHRSRATDPLTRLRNEMDALGRPGMAGTQRGGFGRRAGGADRSVLADVGSQVDVDVDVGVPPLPFHWPGAVADHVDVRNGPGEFGADGLIHMIRYRWDTPPSASTVTVQWRFDDAIAMTHTLPVSTDPYVVTPDQPYAQQVIVGVITSAGANAVGLTAFVYHR